ncbi:condensation domain-containing protein [Streptomyces anulatus]
MGPAIARCRRPDAFEGALFNLIGWHESLRSRFLMEDGVPVQCVTVSSGRPVVSERATEADLGERLAALASERLDPADGPLRPTLLRLSDNDWVLAVLLHHLVIDDWSLAFLEREFSRCNRAQQQPDTGAQARLRHRCSLALTRTPGARPR